MHARTASVLYVSYVFTCFSNFLFFFIFLSLSVGLYVCLCLFSYAILRRDVFFLPSHRSRDPDRVGWREHCLLPKTGYFSMYVSRVHV